VSPPFQIGWYNGWSPAERLATVPVQREAVKSGALPRPTRCSICSVAHVFGSANPVWLHDENYADPLAAYPICRRCHRTLHERFDAAEPWRALVAAHATGSGWFEQLTMDPASLYQPFAVTYPEGLPLP
jgi:hypothetical protein